jgi:carboxypeptidase Q
MSHATQRFASNCPEGVLSTDCAARRESGAPTVVPLSHVDRRSWLDGRHLIITAALVVVPLANSQAQARQSSDSTIRRIWTIGIDSSPLARLSAQLFDSLGPRLTGTPNLRRANHWLIATYASLGIPARDEQYGTWRGWRRGHSHVDLVSPRVRSLEGTMLAYSPGTRGRDLTASTVILPRFADSASFVRWLPIARGKLVLVSAAQPTCRTREDWNKNATPASRVLMDSLRALTSRDWGGRNVRGTGYSLARGTGELGIRLEQGGVAGIVTSSPSDGWGTYQVNETYNARAPAIALSCEDYGLIFRLTANGQHPVMRLNLDAQLLGERPVFNTIAELKGSEAPNEYVVLSAHFDSWDGASGATDNGTATLMVIEAMRILKQVLPHPKRTILAGHWSGEENREVGSRAFAEDHADVLKGLQALFNQDNGTGRIEEIQAQGLPNSATHLASWLARLPGELKDQVHFDGGPGFPKTGGSDDFSFSCHGLPTFRLGARPWDYFEYTWHSNRDTPDKIVFDDVESNAKLTAMLAYLASEDPTMITRERIDVAAATARVTSAISPASQPALPSSWPMCAKAPRSTEPRLK